LEDSKLFRVVKEAERVKKLLVIPQVMVEEILNLSHDMMGHLGVDKTLDYVREILVGRLH
jgi:hypothetical protein